MARTVIIRTREELQAFRGRLENLAPVSEAAGVTIAHDAQRAFNTKRLGTRTWPPRYFGKGKPFVNVAGFLADLNRGMSGERGNHFTRRPGINTGGLQQSISWNVEDAGESVAVGSGKDYAARFQDGGDTSQPITKGAKDGLAKFLRKRPEYRERLGFLFNQDTLETKQIPRPFLGVTDEARADITEEFEAHLAGAPDGPA